MHRALFVIIIAAALACMPWLDRPFSSRGEPREALVAQAMLATGNWISPPAYDGAVPSKPPFSHWLMALASLPGGGVTEASCRLPAAIVFVAFMSVFFLFVAKRTDTTTATLASCILLCAPEWFRAASSCRVDTILATSMAGALLALYRWEHSARKGFPILAAALLSSATLTKGPVGIVLPLGIYGLYRLLREGFSKRAFVSLFAHSLMVAVPVVVIVSLWYVAGYLERGDAFIEKVKYENFDRFTSTMQDKPHNHSVFYLFGVLLVGFLPWSILWTFALMRNWRSFYSCLRKPREWWHNTDELERFSTFAALVIVAFFCIPSSKRGVYLLPAYPFIAFVAARRLSMWTISTQRGMAVIRSAAYFLCGVVVFLFMLLAMKPGLFGAPPIAEAFVKASGLWRCVCVVGALLVLGGPLRPTIKDVAKSPVGSLAISILTLALTANVLLVDPIMYLLSPKRWIQGEEFQSRVSPNLPRDWYSFGSEMYATSFYLKKQFLVAKGPLPEGSLIVVENEDVPRLTAKLSANTRELDRFQTGLSKTSKDLVVVEVAPLSATAASVSSVSVATHSSP